MSSLIERREEIAQQAQHVADQLLEAVDAMRADEGIDEVEEPAGDDNFDERRAAEDERRRLIRAGFQPGGSPGSR